MSAVTKPTRDLLIAATETNDHHGVGIMLQRLFGSGQEFVCLRTTSQYNGDEPFGADHHELCSRFLRPDEIERHLQAMLSRYHIRRILCVPYYREEFVHAVLAKRITGAPLCTFVMDDQNVYTPKVPDRWVSRLLECSDLRLGISVELCAAYGAKFGHRLHLMPPVTTTAAPLLPNYWRPETGEPLRAALIGNVWTAARLDQLRAVLRETGLRLDWYGNGPRASWLTGTDEEWAADGIRCMGFLPEPDLVAALASYPFVLVPSGDLDGQDDNPSFSRLSLPSRLLFLHTHTDTPVLVLGSPETAAARFVAHNGSGLSARHRPDEVRTAISRLADPNFNATCRAAIRSASPALQLAEGGAWIWRSLEAQAPQPAPFDRVFPQEYAIQPLSLPPGSGADIPAPPETPFRIEHAARYAYARRAAIARAIPQGANPAELDLWQIVQPLAAVLLRDLAISGDALFLGNELPYPLRTGTPGLRWWLLRDLAAWARAGYAGDPAHIRPADPSQPDWSGFPQFAAIVSTDWCGSLPDNYHHLEGVSLYLDACTRPGGINLHCFTSVLHPSFLWTAPAFAYFRKRFLPGTPWPDIEDIVEDPDVFFLDERVYAKNWQSTQRKAYADFGRIFFRTLCWQKTPRS